MLAGCGAVLDLVIYCIASDGDSIGIPAPYYPAFDNDVKVRRTRVCNSSCKPARSIGESNLYTGKLCISLLAAA